MKNTGAFFVSVLAFLLSVVHLFAQEKPDFDTPTGKLTSYALAPPEKVYVHTDKDLYARGETIWFKAYLLDGITHNTTAMSRVIYVELVDSKEEIIAQQKLYVAALGAAGDITLPKEIEGGFFTLRAYTKYMLNEKEPVLFQKEILVSSRQSTSNDETDKRSKKKAARKKARKPETDTLQQTKPIVQFFPEGGDLVTGIESVLAAKITDSEGNGLSLEGKILDQNGDMVSLFDSYEFGLGWSSLKAKPETDYYLQIPFNGQMVVYPVPKPISKGYALRIMNRGKHLMISASTNITNGLQGAFLIGHIRGDVIFRQALKNTSENSTTIKLVTSKLQDGIAHFTLFTPNGEPVCERLTFIDNPKNDLELTVETDKPEYGLRDKVDVELALTDAKEKPLTGDFSMSVFTQNQMQKDVDNIKSWLLLNSDLGGTISNPNYFFEEDVKGREYLLDLLMLTHGWRKFTWKSIMSDSIRKEVSFPPEKGIMINGTTTAFNNKYQPKKALATLNIVSNELIQEKKMTNAQGKFNFGPLIFMDSITAVIKAKSISLTNKKKDRISIYLNPHYPEVKVKNNGKTDGGSTKKIINTTTKPFPSAVEQNTTPDFEYDPNITYLNEVVVKDRKISKRALLDEKLNARTLHGFASSRLIPDSIPEVGPGTPTFDMLRSVGGVQVFGTFPNQSVSIRSEGALFLLDGIRTSPAVIQTIPISNILFIDVLKGAEATIYGGLGPGRISGVIAVYTKTGDEIVQNPDVLSGVTNVSIPGFYKAREFFKPNYAIAKPAHKKPDYRRTLHWEPDIKIETGSASKLNFYTGDTAGKYVIRVEGISVDGRPVNELYGFNVLN